MAALALGASACIIIDNGDDNETSDGTTASEESTGGEETTSATDEGTGGDTDGDGTSTGAETTDGSTSEPTAGPGESETTDPTSETSEETSTTGGGPVDGDAQLCVNIINDYRGTLGLPPYARWSDGEACADGQCESDALSGVAHGAFGQCGEFAQNECPGWGGNVDDIPQVLEDCLALMWAEGPGEDFNMHGHYINMSSESYTEVACGFHVTADNKIWAIQNFR